MMTLTLELTPEQERQLEEEARQQNLDTISYAKARLFEKDMKDDQEWEQSLPVTGPLPPPNGTGADLVAYWEREGLVGTRTDIKDSAKEARAIRQTAERRVRE